MKKTKRVNVIETERTLIEVLPAVPKQKAAFNRAPMSMPERPDGRGGRGKKSVSTEGFARIVHQIDRTRWEKHEGEWRYDFHKRTPVCYEMYFEPERYRFFLSTPAPAAESLSRHIEKAWANAGAKVVSEDYIQHFEDNPSSYADIEMERYFIFPLDTCSGDLLAGLINVAKGLMNHECFMLQLAMSPIASNRWQNQGRQILNTYLETGNRQGGSGFETFLNDAEMEVTELFDILTGTLLGLKEEEKKPKQALNQQVNAAELDAVGRKLMEHGFTCTIRVYASAKTKTRRTELLNDVASMLRSIEGHNQLRLARMSHSIPCNVAKRELGTGKTILSISEVAGWLQPPEQNLLHKTPQIRKANQLDTPIPDSMYQGTVALGVVNAEMNPQMIYLDHRDVERYVTTKILCGAPGSGKTTFLQTYVSNLQRLKQGVFIFDFIKENECTKEIAEELPEGSYEVWDYGSDWKHLSFNYNELYTNFDPEDHIGRKIVAKKIGSQLELLVKSIAGDEGLTGRMCAILTHVARLVFIHPNQTLKTYFDAIRYYEVRHALINKGLADRDRDGNAILTQDDLDNLKLLDKFDAEGNDLGETDTGKVQPILNRITRLISDPRVETMLANDADPKYDMVSCIKENRLVMVRVPQSQNSETGEYGYDLDVRALITAFISFKLWLIKESFGVKNPNELVVNEVGETVKRQDLYITHIIYDEIHQVPEAMSMLSCHMKEFRKFRLSAMFATHGLSVFGNVEKELDNLGCAYILLSPTEHATIEKLAKKFEPDVSVEELYKLPKRYLAAYVPGGEGYVPFIAKAPGPIAQYQKLLESLNQKQPTQTKKREKAYLPADKFFNKLEQFGIRVERTADAPINHLINAFWRNQTPQTTPQEADVVQVIETSDSLPPKQTDANEPPKPETNVQIIDAPQPNDAPNDNDPIDETPTAKQPDEVTTIRVVKTMDQVTYEDLETMEGLNLFNLSAAHVAPMTESTDISTCEAVQEAPVQQEVTPTPLAPIEWSNAFTTPVKSLTPTKQPKTMPTKTKKRRVAAIPVSRA